MVKALADRLAEAFAERLHQRVRKEFWAYAPDEALAAIELIGEKYRGIRPGARLPRAARPQREGDAVRVARRRAAHRRQGSPRALRCGRGASVCGLYFSHPESHYFGVGKIERDQVEDYADARAGRVAEAERWLAPVLNYDPLAAARTAAE